MAQTERQRRALRESNERSRERAREDIREALLQLMEAGDYDAIRTTDIIRRAGVARSAFYRNYYTKRDVLDDALLVANADFDGAVPEDVLGNWRLVFEHIERHARLYRLLRKAGLTDIVLDNMNAREVPEGLRPEFLMWNGMIYNVALSWLDGGMRETANEMLGRVARTLAAMAGRMGTVPPATGGTLS